MSIRVPGKEKELGGVMRIVAPLNAAAVKQYREQINAISTGQIPDIELVAKLAYASLKRNYPQITLEEVEDVVDYDNFFELWVIMMNVSGLVEQAGKLARRVQDQMTAAGLTT